MKTPQNLGLRNGFAQQLEMPPVRNNDPLRALEPRLGSGLCFIYRDSVLCSPDDPPGPGDAEPKLQMTQKELDVIIGKRVGEAQKKYSDYEDLKSKAAKAAEHEAELLKLREEKELEGKSAADKAKIEAERAAKAIERERSEFTTKLTVAEKRAEKAEQERRDLIVSIGLGSALDQSKVLPAARDKAVRLMLAESTVELDDAGKIASVTYGGVAHKTVAEAAAAFLKDNDFLAAAPKLGGAGSKPPNLGGKSDKSLFEMSEEELLRAGATPPR